jgi:hypothetical protein
MESQNNSLTRKDKIKKARKKMKDPFSSYGAGIDVYFKFLRECMIN